MNIKALQSNTVKHTSLNADFRDDAYITTTDLPTVVRLKEVLEKAHRTLSEYMLGKKTTLP